MPRYVEAICREALHVGGSAPANATIHTIFFGGGTPSLLPTVRVAEIIGAVRRGWLLEEGAEISLEVNPGTVSAGGLRDLRRTGINRLSLGVQSANGEELRMMERSHTYEDVLDAVSSARAAGFINFNMDLIYGLPEQSLATWKRTVERVLKLQPAHLSAYALTIEHGTPFGQWMKRGLLPIPDPDLAADMYEWLGEQLSAEGYRQYEISNWAREGCECLHNLQYWRGDPYIGLGAGAHGYAGGVRSSNALGIKVYMSRLEEADQLRFGQRPENGSTSVQDGKPCGFPCSPAVVECRHQTVEDDMGDHMIMGLRLTEEGVDESEFRRRFGRHLGDVYGPQIAELTRQGLLEWHDGGDEVHAGPGLPDAHSHSRRLRLTFRGRLLGNRVFAEFVGT